MSWATAEGEQQPRHSGNYVLVAGVEEVDQFAFAEAFAVLVGEGAVDQAAAVAGLVADQSGYPYPGAAFGE
ncbi:hypothetical protein GCM10023170_012580 [Phytohabitans houttuyneae]|uniref:Uncharacterized protein n=1 Tax=Phytohabitans houttuyneae TaxID=1076126 RepID=A0A6V8KCD0_9ACTN|nr:hypothetical protein Phou_038360 [Phytohabitans houttuyneae]